VKLYVVASYVTLVGRDSNFGHPTWGSNHRGNYKISECAGFSNTTSSSRVKLTTDRHSKIDTAAETEKGKKYLH
jgi:outer membrane translocation and assembly module TamA